MKYIKNTIDFHIEEDTVISLGKFDGIHRGHEKLLEYLAKRKNQGLKTVIFTFDIPPKKQIENIECSRVLTTNEEKMQLFAQHGIDYLIECPFTTEIMRMEPETFVEMLVRELHVKSFVVGTDFAFGHKRRGNYLLLQQLSAKYGYETDVVDKVKEAQRDISSTFIREEIVKGSIEKANSLLGYRYFVCGRVVHGNQIGRTLNVPTANIIPPQEKLLPPLGVYVTKTKVHGKYYRGITNVGCKPTLNDKNPIGIENHLFDFGEDIYGEEIKIEFVKSVRAEMKFSSLEELKQQMQKDIAFGKSIT